MAQIATYVHPPVCVPFVGAVSGTRNIFKLRLEFRRMPARYSIVHTVSILSPEDFVPVCVSRITDKYTVSFSRRFTSARSTLF